MHIKPVDKPVMHESNRTDRPRAWRYATAIVLLAAASLVTARGLTASPAPAPAPQDDVAAPVSPLSDARSALQQWVETRRVIANEKRDWTLGREMLSNRTELLTAEIEGLVEKTDEADRTISQTDDKIGALESDKATLENALASLDGMIRQLEQRTLALLKRLPDPVRDRVRPLSQQIPVPDESGAIETRLSVPARFANVIGVLNEVNRSNREVSVTSEVRTLPDGTTAEVTALYVGVAYGYYSGANGTIAGVGRPPAPGANADGWVWTPANDAADRIAAAIAIVQNEQVAEFVQLPVTVQ